MRRRGDACFAGPRLVPNLAIDGASSGWSWHSPSVDAGDGRLPGLLHGAHAGGRPARMADDAAAAEIEQVERPAGAPIGLRRLAAPLAGARRPAGRNRRAKKIGVMHRLEGGDEDCRPAPNISTPMPLIWNWSTPSSRQNCC